MALTDLTRISTSGIATGTSLSGAILHNDAHFRGTQVGVTSALFDSSDNALELGDNVKLKFGNLPDFSIEHNTTVTPPANQLTSSSLSQLEIIADNLELRSGTGDKSYLTATVGSATTLFFNNTPRFKTTDHGAVITGILTATSFSGPTYNTSGIATFYDLRVSNNLTVEGTTTTLDTNLIGVDRVEVGADSNTIVGVAVTQSGTADIVNLFDGANKVLAIDDTGKVGIGSDAPTLGLDINKGANSGVFLGNPTHGYKVRANVTSSNDYGLMIEDEDGVDLYRAVSSTGTSNADTHTFYTAGSEKLRITSGGSVGIGLTNPESFHAQARTLVLQEDGHCGLTIDATSSTNSSIFFADGADGSEAYRGYVQYTHSDGTNSDYLTFGTAADEKLRITSDGKLGIGTITPGDLVHINTTNNVGGLRFGNAQNLNAGTIRSNWNTIDLIADQNLTFQTDGDTRMKITNVGKVGIGTDNPTAHLQVYRQTVNASNPVLEVRSNHDTTNSIKFSIDGDGEAYFSDNVGIGTDTPTGKLEINTASSTQMITLNVSNANFARIGHNSASGTAVLDIRSEGHTRFLAGGNSEKLRIHSDGKISIGSDETSTGLLLLDKNITAESDVSDKNNYHLVIRSQSDSNTAKIGIAFANTSDDTHVGAAILHHRETTDSIGSLAFYTSPSSGVTSERFRITRYGELGLSGANYGTDGQVLTSGGAGQPAEWRTIVQAPVISSISGSIVANLSGTTLTLSGQHFGTGQGTVNFSGGSLNPSKNVNVTPTSDTSMTVTVPSNVANNVNSGETITVKFTNSAGLIGSGTNTTVIAAPSGGTITTSGNYRIHTFTSSSNFVLTKAIACEYLVIAGGGGGGGNDGGQDYSGGAGGGGAGGYRTGTITPSANTHTVTVGGGGAGNNSAAAGGDGNNSAFGSIVSNGGGGGGGCNNAGSNGRNGGSGGGAAGDDGSSTFTGGSATSGQGNAGGNAGGSVSNAGGGGGGGAGAAGETAANGFAGGDGGTGAVNSINGSSAVWAGGGGGSVGAGTDKGVGGAGGGGNGAARSTSNSTAGVTNTGGGGGAGADSNVTSEKAGSNGGSGIVIVRYDITNL